MLVSMILSSFAIVLFLMNVVLFKNLRTSRLKLRNVNNEHNCELHYDPYKTIEHSRGNSIIGYTSVFKCRKCGNFKKNNVMIHAEN